jgi:hypothetical protein
MNEVEQLIGKKVTEAWSLILVPERGLLDIDLRLRPNDEA